MAVSAEWCELVRRKLPGGRDRRLPDHLSGSARRPVRGVLVGMGIAFESAGSTQLKGLSGRWALFRVTSGPTTAVLPAEGP